MSASLKQYKKTEIYSLSLNILTGSAQVTSLVLLENFTGKGLLDLACSPDSSKVVAVLWDYQAQRLTLCVCCTQSGALIRTTSFKSAIGHLSANATLSFVADGQDILICVLQLQTIKAIVDSRSFKSLKSDEPRRVQVLDLYCLTRFESEGSSKGIVY